MALMDTRWSVLFVAPLTLTASTVDGQAVTTVTQGILATIWM